MRTIVLTALVLVAACRGGEMTSADTAAIRADVERTMREAYDLSKPDPVVRMLSIYPSTGRVVSANAGTALTSKDSIAVGIREFWEYVGVNMRSPRWEWTNIYVDVLARDAAVATGTYQIPHRNPNNQPHTLGGAMTLVFRKEGGRWVVIQEHLSDTPMMVDSTDIMATPENH